MYLYSDALINEFIIIAEGKKFKGKVAVAGYGIRGYNRTNPDHRDGCLYITFGDITKAKLCTKMM